MEQFIPDTKKVIDILKFSDVDIIGSFSDSSPIKYFGDIDTQEVIDWDGTLTDLHNFFADKIIKLMKDEDIYLVDIKAGLYSAIPQKWTPQEVVQGYKDIDGGKRKLFFEQVFTNESVIKIDVILFQDGNFVELTINYYFRFPNGMKSFRIYSDEDMRKKIRWSYQKEKEINFYKSLKRLFLYYKFIEDIPNMNKMVDVLNSDFGFVNKQISSLKTLDMIMEKVPDISKSKITTALSKIKKNLDKFPEFSLSGKYKNMTKSDIHKFINEEIGRLSDALNSAALELKGIPLL
jgi:hypothetical protein